VVVQRNATPMRISHDVQWHLPAVLFTTPHTNGLLFLLNAVLLSLLLFFPHKPSCIPTAFCPKQTAAYLTPLLLFFLPSLQTPMHPSMGGATPLHPSMTRLHPLPTVVHIELPPTPHKLPHTLH
jgi:hypothetical protein